MWLISDNCEGILLHKSLCEVNSKGLSGSQGKKGSEGMEMANKKTALVNAVESAACVWKAPTTIC